MSQGMFEKEDLISFATMAEEIGVKLSELGAIEHDRLQTELEPKWSEANTYLADMITLNAAANSLANLVAVAIASQRDGDPRPHRDRVKKAVHELVWNLIGSDGGKAVFLTLPNVDETEGMK